MIKDAWWIVRKELRFQFISLLFTFATTAFCALLTAYFFQQAIVQTKNDFVLHYFLDVIFLYMMPNFTIIYLAGHYLDSRTMKEDPPSKLMQFYRTSPISLQTLTLSRSLKTLVLFLTQMLLFDLIFLGLLTAFELPISSHNLLLFLLIWLGYGLALGSFLPYLEYGKSAKSVYQVSFLWLGVMLAIHFSLKSALGVGIVKLVWDGLQQMGLLMVLVSLVAGGLSFYFWNRRLYHRLQTRDYL